MKSAAARLVSYTTKFGDRAKFVGDPPPNKFGDPSSKFGDRPPIPGSEEGSKIFLEVAPAHPLPLMGHSERALNLEQSARLEKTMSPKPASESRDRGFEPEGSADVTPPFSESNSNQSTPAYVRSVFYNQIINGGRKHAEPTDPDPKTLLLSHFVTIS